MTRHLGRVAAFLQDFGPCCACGKTNDPTVRNVLCLDFEAPQGFHGWGCVQCGAPARGAIAIVCDQCLEARTPLSSICSGHGIAAAERVPLKNYDKRPFGHIAARHPEITLN